MLVWRISTVGPVEIFYRGFPVFYRGFPMVTASTTSDSGAQDSPPPPPPFPPPPPDPAGAGASVTIPGGGGGPPPPPPPPDPFAVALGYFKDWSNYLLVTTAAALGWIVTSKDLAFSGQVVRSVTTISSAISIVFGMLTLALIPIVQAQRRPQQSNYDVEATFDFLVAGKCRLKSVCYPQHIFFICGIIAFTMGTIWKPRVPAVEVLATVIFLIAAWSVHKIWRSTGGWDQIREMARRFAGR